MAIRRLLIVGVLVAVIIVFQCCWTTYYSLLDADGGSVAFPVEVSISGTSEKEGVFRSTATNVMLNVTFASYSKQYASEKEADLDHEMESDGERNSREGHIKSFKVGSHEDAVYSFTQKRPKYADLRTSDRLLAVEKTSNASRIQSVEIEPQNEKPRVLKSHLLMLNSKPKMVLPSSLTQMNSLLLQSFNSASMRPRLSSRCDRELKSAKLEIENARVISNSSGLYAPIFRDVAKFSRSYELMERKLKVFIYREGAKPIFHQPKMRGIYASEGWFMKLMERNKRFIVKDPQKAHLFYLPFSSQMLRVTLSNRKQMEQYLEKYVELIAGRYRFWNRTGGADHFLVACHDWVRFQCITLISIYVTVNVNCLKIN
ncbi:putative glycosyltransferase, partial [Mucuna pruriens]